MFENLFSHVARETIITKIFCLFFQSKNINFHSPTLSKIADQKKFLCLILIISVSRETKVIYEIVSSRNFWRADKRKSQIKMTCFKKLLSSNFVQIRKVHKKFVVYFFIRSENWRVFFDKKTQRKNEKMFYVKHFFGLKSFPQNQQVIHNLKILPVYNMWILWIKK